jgi:hypothetical protein
MYRHSAHLFVAFFLVINRVGVVRNANDCSGFEVFLLVLLKSWLLFEDMNIIVTDLIVTG